MILKNGWKKPKRLLLLMKGQKNMNIGTDIKIKSHLLIGGQSGSGKSVAMNGLIIETLLDNPKDQIILIDAKLVEFNRYRSIAPVFTDINDILQVIEQLHHIMMDRYRKMAATDSIEWKDSHIYVFIDEIAELFTHENKRIAKALSDKLKSIARLGRASGIHLIMATQYPTAKVLPMQIKMNTSRLCLKCAGNQGYRVMLDGIDKSHFNLKGNGDALYLDDEGKITRFQVNYYSDEIVKDFITEAKKYYQYKPR